MKDGKLVMKLSKISKEEKNSIKEMDQRLNDIISKSTDLNYEGTDFYKDELAHHESKNNEMVSQSRPTVRSSSSDAIGDRLLAFDLSNKISDPMD